MSKKIVVIGGGITGLSAAFWAMHEARTNGADVEVTVLEREETFGGKVRTVVKDGFVMEQGPDSFLGRKLPMLDLVRALGFEDQLVATNPAAKKTYIIHKGKAHLMPQGLMLGVPTQVGPFMRTGLISLIGKLRAGFDLVLPRRDVALGDESLGSFLRRRLGDQVMERIAEPLLAGIYAGDCDKLSLRATFPQFESIEHKHRSLIIGMTKSRQQVASSTELPAIAKRSLFLSFQGGLTSLIAKLIERLENDGVKLMNNTGVTTINKSATGYTLTLTNGLEIEADRVIVATPAFAAADLLEPIEPTVSKLRAIDYVSVANVILAYDKAHIQVPLDGSGYVVPKREGRLITACTWTSSKWGHTAPDNRVVLRCYVGRQGHEIWQSLTDEQIITGVRKDLRELSDVAAEPLFVQVNRWPKSMPQYPVGHLEVLDDVQADLTKSAPGIFLAGSAYYGVGLPDCIKQGKDVARKAVHK
jgi:oxygen-dependent protoporphyrinogen oxidase